MRSYALTSYGRARAHTIHAPDTSDWRAIFYLDKKGRASSEEIARYCGMDDNEASRVMSHLKYFRPQPIVMEV